MFEFILLSSLLLLRAIHIEFNTTALYAHAADTQLTMLAHNSPCELKTRRIILVNLHKSILHLSSLRVEQKNHATETAFIWPISELQVLPLPLDICCNCSL